MRDDAPAAIGRFQVIRTLGTGAQGSVFLARDPHLNRDVAIKSIAAAAPVHTIERLLQEARVVSQFSHPHIVTLYDALEQNGRHYLVFEYVDGMTLEQILRREGRIERTRAATIALQVADGLAYAHGKHVIHRDIKPSNIIIDAHGTARITDFGIAAVSGEFDTSRTMQGTPRYMAPERLGNHAAHASADVFSLGMVLYEMLTGRPAVHGNSVYEVMHKIANEPFEAPSRHNPEIDEQLDHLVCKALLKNDTERYATALEFKQALDDYLAPAATSAPDASAGKGTLDFLLRRIRHKSNFPALSQTISTINRISDDSDERVQTLSSALLKDFALTNKLLQLINSSAYGQFGGNISTITRAVMILGFKAVRDLSITLILFEHLQNKGLATQLREDVIGAYFTGLIARRVSVLCGVQDREESFICGVFHHLGRLLATYYFYEEATEITKRMEQGESEDQASRTVLGITHEELGIGVARAWNLPDILVHSMQHVGASAQKHVRNSDKLRIIASLASELHAVASTTGAEDKTTELADLGHRFGGALGLDNKQFTAVVDGSVKEFAAQSEVFVNGATRSRTLKMIRQWSSDETGDPLAGTATVAADPTHCTVPPAGVTVDAFLDQTSAVAVDHLTADATDAIATLSCGIQDITNTLVSDFNLNDVLRIILETMYRGMGFSQVLLCMRDVRTNRAQARFGFGANIGVYLKLFSVPLGQVKDVFQIALDKNVDLYIADTRADNIVNRIPAWYRENIASRSFLVLPIVIHNKIIGMLYADRDEAGQTSIEPHQLKLLKTLRNQAVLAIRQKY